MKKVFYLKSEKIQGSLRGPYKVSHILNLLLNGVISRRSLISVLKDKNYQPLFCHKEFKKFFSDDENWILLKKYQNRFVQSGNYSTKGIQILLCHGFVQDQDFVWKEGFSSWKRISVCSDFHTRLDSTIEDLMDQSSMEYKELDKSRVFSYQRKAPPRLSEF